MYRNLLFTILVCVACFTCSRTENESGNTRLFKLIPPSKSGVEFSNIIKETLKQNILSYEYFYNGGGVALGDLNNDGLHDIFLTGNQVEDRLYLNKGNMEFQDITKEAGFAKLKGRWSTGVTMVDINSDGFLDIYISRSGKVRPTDRENKLYINQGDLTFQEQSKDYGLNDRGFSTQAIFLDYDRDNDLDAFILNHNVIIFYEEDGVELQKKVDPFVGDKLYRNDDGKFVDVSATSGIHQNPLGYGLGVGAGDLNNDGFTDLYITNDYDEPDYLYINNGDGTFSDEILTQTSHISNFGMGVDIADINNDLLPDVFVADMTPEDNYRQKTTMRAMAPEKFYKMVEYGFHHQYMFNTLQLNNGNSSFSEVAQLANVSKTDWSWATLLIDFNNDGFKDLFVSNGYRKEISNKDYLNYRKELINSVKGTSRENRMNALKTILEEIPTAQLPNYVFENSRGLHFTKRSEEWGLDISTYSNGASVADLDNDGDLDLVINNIDTLAFIYENTLGAIKEKTHLKIKLDGPQGNASGLGAKIIATAGDKTIYQEHFLTRGYQSSVSDIIHLGLGKVDLLDELKIIWPDGKQETLYDISTNQQITLTYQNADEAPNNSTQEERLFLDISERAGLEFVHEENKFNDFNEEILLPHKISQFGPALAVGDLNGDQRDDFYIGGASGQAGEIFMQASDGTFLKSTSRPWAKDLMCEDIDAEFFDSDGDGDLDLYVVSGGNEFENDGDELADRLYLNDGKGDFVKSYNSLPEIKESGSVVRPFDYDKDGDMDLFIGGRIVPKKWPSPANSRLLKNDKGKFVDVTEIIAPELLNLGLVTDAIWSDINGNDKTDLIITGEWMSITVMEYDGKSFENISSSLGFDKDTGWWYSIAHADFDQDGDVDLIAGNLGKNYKYKASDEEPFQVYYNDFDGNGTGDIVLGYYNDGGLFPLRGRQCSSEQMPFIKEKFKTYHEFGAASLEEIYGQGALADALHYRATNFSSSFILNSDNSSWSFIDLPDLAQVSSTNKILIDDFNSDGLEDVLLAGNMYNVEPETIRNDASFGALLLNTGDDFKYEPNRSSGLFIEGEVRAMKLISLANNKKGILIGLNNGPLKLILINNPPKTQGT